MLRLKDYALPEANDPPFANIPLYQQYPTYKIDKLNKHYLLPNYFLGSGANFL